MSTANIEEWEMWKHKRAAPLFLYLDMHMYVSIYFHATDLLKQYLKWNWTAKLAKYGENRICNLRVAGLIFECYFSKTMIPDIERYCHLYLTADSKYHVGYIVGHLWRNLWLLVSYPGKLVRLTDSQGMTKKVLKFV